MSKIGKNNPPAIVKPPRPQAPLTPPKVTPHRP
jgi:hypothetical protein